MPLPAVTQLFCWGVAFLSALAVLWLLGDIVLPFFLGATIAYVLDPLADRLQRLGCSRTLAVIIISAGMLLALIMLVVILAPLLREQSAELIARVPQLIQDLHDAVETRFPGLIEQDSAMRQSLSGFGDAFKARAGELLNAVWASATSLFNLVMLLVVVPVVAFYMLLDWDRMIASVDSLLPRQHAPVIRRLAAEVDETLAAFVRGMGSVCLILGTYYALALLLVGLQFGLFIGFVAGILTFIPYVGAAVGGGMAVGLALFQFWGEWPLVGAVAVIFLAGQLVEGNFLTPRLVGSSVGLHPVWLFLALSIFGSLFGFIGLLVGVPLAATIGVFVRYGLERYRSSSLFGAPAPPVPAPTGEGDE